ncbi:MAG: hypothetical protein LH629_07280 [Ignavibacteria bacterium]|nr:hypothetical protein [Ignavibacteria bacterium]
MSELKIKIRNNLVEKFYKISENSKKTFSYHINEALKNYIEDQSELEVALKRFSDKSDKVISSKDLRKRLNL